jgi:hypothetical protein
VSAGEQRVASYQPDVIAASLLVVVVVLVWGTLKYWLAARSADAA